MTWEFATDGWRTVELTVEDGRGRTRTVERTLLVLLDQDRDDVTRSVELARGLDPDDSDTDGDAVRDGLDPMGTNFWVPTGVLYVVVSVASWVALFGRRVGR